MHHSRKLQKSFIVIYIKIIFIKNKLNLFGLYDYELQKRIKYFPIFKIYISIYCSK